MIEFLKQRFSTATSTGIDALARHHPDISQYRDEYDSSGAPEVEETRAAVARHDINPGEMAPAACRDLYAVVRAVDAEVVVETGVANGISTTALLAATAATDGHVTSIDLPYQADKSLEEQRDETFQGFRGAAVPPGKASGWAISDHLRDHWTLHEGKSQRLLPDVLSDAGEIDVFVHDSEHSQLCMSFELEAAWPRLRPGGVLVCDDIPWNDVWNDFTEERVPDGYHGELADGVGYAVKPEEGA